MSPRLHQQRLSYESQAFWGHYRVSLFCIISGAQDWTVGDSHLQAAGKNRARESWYCHEQRIKHEWNPLRGLTSWCFLNSVSVQPKGHLWRGSSLSFGRLWSGRLPWILESEGHPSSWLFLAAPWWLCPALGDSPASRAMRATWKWSVRGPQRIVE